MRGLRIFTIALLVSALSVLLLASSAMADSFHRDPDDTATSFDIRAVRTLSHLQSRALLLSATTYDVLEWTANTYFWFYLDSRSGPNDDFLLYAWVRHDVAHCWLYDRYGLLGDVGVNVGPRRATCRVRKRLLRPAHTIRYSVKAVSRNLTHHVVSDWAPGGFGNWYPHV
jgi:hypothetical protein